MLYASSDFVWDGNGEFYGEGEAPLPTNAYGRSKIAGERAVAEHGCGLIARYSLLFDLPIDRRQTSWTEIATRLARNEPVAAIDYEWRSPITLEDAAFATIEMATQPSSWPCTYLSPAAMTPYELINMMRLRQRINSTSEIKRVSRTTFRSNMIRPRNVTQSNSRLQNLLPRFEPAPLVSALCIERAALQRFFRYRPGVSWSGLFTSFHDYLRLNAKTLIVVANSRPGKTEALNRGDRERRDGPVLYLDADTIILPGSLAAINEPCHRRTASCRASHDAGSAGRMAWSRFRAGMAAFIRNGKRCRRSRRLCHKSSGPPQAAGTKWNSRRLSRSTDMRGFISQLRELRGRPRAIQQFHYEWTADSSVVVVSRRQRRVRRLEPVPDQLVQLDELRSWLHDPRNCYAWTAQGDFSTPSIG